MSIEPDRLSVIIPAHNEERRIEATLIDLRRALPGAELIVVVNNSTDGTAAIVQTITSTDPDTRMLDIPARVGKGGAVRIGFGLATKPYVAFVDADGATSGAEIGRLLSYLEKCDCVVASRWLSGARIEAPQSALRRILGRGFNACVRLLFGMNISDTQCGAKLFHRSVLVHILDEIETADFAFDVDLLFAVHRRKLSIREEPTVWRERAGSRVDIRAAVPRMFLSLVRLRLRHSLLRFSLPIFDRYFRLSPIRSRRALRYLVLAPGDGRSERSSELERNVRALFDEIESPAREIVWFSLDSLKWIVPSPQWLPAMVAYLRWFRDGFDCVVEVLPGDSTFLTPLYCLKPKVVVKGQAARLPRFYSAALVMDSHLPSRRELEEALLLAMTRASMHLYVDKDGHLVLGERVSRQAMRELLIARAEASAT
jgi:glycosyltransferase involved in cell wall biosynthesis